MPSPFIRLRDREDWRRPRGGSGRGDLWSGEGANFRAWLHGKPQRRHFDTPLICSGIVFASTVLGYIYSGEIVRLISWATFRLQHGGW